MLAGVGLLVTVGGVLAWGMAGSAMTATVVDARTGAPLADAELTVDGAPVALTSGNIDTKTDLGAHKVEITAPGYETVTRTIESRIFRTTALGEVPLRNAELVVTVVEDYPGEPPVKAARLEIAGSSAEVRKGDPVRLEGLPVGPTELKATARDCEPFALGLTLEPGQNDVVVRLTPEMLIVVRRAMQASFDYDHVLSWELLHPDRQRLHGSRSAYIKKRREAVNELLNEAVVPQRFKVLTPVFLQRYHDKAIGKTYRDVYRVPITMWAGAPQLAIFGMKSIAVTQDSYWIKTEEGRWLSLGDGEPVDE